MLDRAQALLDRELDVLDADVVLKVDEGLDAPVAEHVQGRAERAALGCGRALDGVGAGAGRGEAGRLRRRAAGRVALGERVGEPERRVAGAGGALALDRGAGPEHLQPPRRRQGVPRDCENRCTEGVQPPDMRSASQAIRRMPPGCAASRTAVDARAALDLVDGGLDRDPEAGRAGRLRQRPGRLVAQIGDQLDCDAGLVQIEGGAIGARRAR